MEKFTFFYGGKFSQWFPCLILIDKLKYNCAEQYMMAQKALLFKDEEAYKKIMIASHPKEQKSLGRTIKNFNISIWQEQAKEIVYQGNYAKFIQHKHLKEILLKTEGTLVEASPYDRIWGIGLSETDPRALDRKTWLGSNWLGEVLTQVRDDIKEWDQMPDKMEKISEKIAQMLGEHKTP